ncbi:MAG: hypothetical protein LC808_15390, partial [Actinobacteria bacterium]|nr:hypothetical protein [Actinomycetota bacterium]
VALDARGTEVPWLPAPPFVFAMRRRSVCRRRNDDPGAAGGTTTGVPQEERRTGPAGGTTTGVPQEEPSTSRQGHTTCRDNDRIPCPVGTFAEWPPISPSRLVKDPG